MHLYILEPRLERHAGLTAELASARLVAVPIDESFFRRDLGLLLQGGAQGRPFLLSVAAPEVAGHVRALRAAGCMNPVLTMRDMRNSAHAAALLDAGADDDLVVPIKAQELRSRIHAIQRRASGHAAESLQLGEVTAFFDGRDPEVAGQRIKLSRREHAIFHHLALNAEKVVSKAAIYDAVYGMAEAQPFDKVIDVYICKIRKKIDAAAETGRQYIETVHGRGYKLSSGMPLDGCAAAV
ncbi:response regulator transcription factor [Pseudoroseicyclus aestuarii]|uniref:Two-component system cell cycle response regulator CtrA n=1 Tax=Pseudoroseicyclus aestuarii TaxID=1795041 RepID=A0A318SX23_9RHOB|nr:response regulator transcription factor [Pseudoroseicyclus aestuarii]PYE84377.1 two-component system cell cycle response regulator CtrA [Pseudoroseicyclus aestuarii]